MKHMCTLLLGLALSLTGMAQTDSIPTRENSDTIRVGDIIIIRKGGMDSSESRKEPEFEVYDRESISIFPSRKGYRRERISTNWLIFDIGFTNFRDETDYSSAEAIAFMPGANPSINGGDFSLKTKSSNINIWLFMQRMSLIRNVVNLKYGFGIEMHNFYYKSQVRYVDGANPYVIRDNIQFSKNKLAADYLTVPLMLNINTSPKTENGGISFSVGASAGYLYSSRTKYKSDEFGKQKDKGNFNLERWKVSAIAELGLGPVRFYGTYAITPLHQYGVEQYPYSVGVRFSRW